MEPIITMETDKVFLSLHLGQLFGKYKTNDKINSIINKLKNKQKELPRDEYMSVCEVNKLVVMIIQEILILVNNEEIEYG